MKYTILISRLCLFFYKEKGFIILLLFLCCQISAQINNPSASSLISFEKYSVDHSTGMPQISLPLYTMPTRSKDVMIDMSLNYHPSSVAVYNNEIGDCGHGWSLYKGGGVVYRTILGVPDEISFTNNTNETPDLYEFRFMGYSGKFTVEKYSNNTLGIFVTENKGNQIRVELDYDATTYKINYFTLYDDKGYGYEFNIADETVFLESGVPKTIYKSAYHMTRIHDSNNITLVSFQYNIYNRTLPYPYHETGDKNTFHIMNGIDASGIGSVDFTGLQTNNFTFHYYEYETVTIQYQGAVVKDFLENIVREFTFHYDYSDEVRVLLEKVDETNDSITRSYHFEYKTGLFPLESHVKSYDRWGYYNLTDKWCYYDITGDRSDISKLSNNYLANGILQKILLPSGGSIVYEFERNTYYYTKSKPLDQVFNSTTQAWQTINDFFYNLDPAAKGNNTHNYHVETYANKNYSPHYQGALSFSVTGTKKFYFKFDATPDEVEFIDPLNPDPDGIPTIIYVYPVFTLKKDGNTVFQFSITNANLHIGYGNHLNSGFGKDLELTTGNYTIEMSHSNVTSGSVMVNEVHPIAQPKKWWYGGGIRIKKVGYFTKDVNKKYYQNGLTTPLPTKEISYDYNFFNEPDKSSGYLKDIEYDPSFFDYESYDIIRYKNVTVRETDNNGKTQYVYYSPIDNLFMAEYTIDQKVGRLQEAKSYNSSGNLLHKTEYDYDATTPTKFLASNVLVWNLPKKITEMTYYSGNEFKTLTGYEYNSDLKMKRMFQHTSRSNDTISTRFYYDYNNSVYSKNRRAVERTERYKNGELQTTSTVTFSKTWPQVAEDFLDTNVSYLPVKTENSKESHSAYVSGKVTLYDVYSNVIEFENETGVKTVNIWGYNKTLLVAKLENIAYSQVPQNLIAAIHTASNSGNESSLLSALNNLRNDTALSGAMITTYTYKPLVGVSTMIDVQKRRTTYEYDDFGRLERVKDHDGNVLSKNEYHLRTQN